MEKCFTEQKKQRLLHKPKGSIGLDSNRCLNIVEYKTKTRRHPLVLHLHCPLSFPFDLVLMSLSTICSGGCLVDRRHRLRSTAYGRGGGSMTFFVMGSFQNSEFLLSMLHAQMVGHSWALLQRLPTCEIVSEIGVATYIPQHAEEVVALLLFIPPSFF